MGPITRCAALSRKAGAVTSWRSPADSFGIQDGGGLARGRAERRLAAAECRGGGEGAAGVWLGLVALWVGCRERLAKGAADPPQAGAAGGVHLLSDAGARDGRLARSGSGGGHKVDHRGFF